MGGPAAEVCGTGRESVAGEYGWAPLGKGRRVLGHRPSGRVREAVPGSGFGAGDLVVGVVCRPDPEPCGACARDESDMCGDGRCAERGTEERHGRAGRPKQTDARRSPIRPTRT
ncbi:hypothetical protein CP979_04135 [Streptomyces filamentosus]|nr:alcohol dehydrogenase catalytic domain-containing protein [Streptomyces filamentosus]KAA6216226.1 hypothetical protein CP979_04135 [Streptomyces filamentosus]